MPEKYLEIAQLLGALLISIISVTASITRRMAKGETYSVVKVISELLTALLAGYLMYSAYPSISDAAPSWFTLPIAVSLAAHVGGRLFQELEDEFMIRLKAKLKQII